MNFTVCLKVDHVVYVIKSSFSEFLDLLREMLALEYPKGKMFKVKKNTNIKSKPFKMKLISRQAT